MIKLLQQHPNTPRKFKQKYQHNLTNKLQKSTISDNQKESTQTQPKHTNNHQQTNELTRIITTFATKKL